VGQSLRREGAVAALAALLDADHHQPGDNDDEAQLLAPALHALYHLALSGA
jgi:hypothetical protein